MKDETPHTIPSPRAIAGSRTRATIYDVGPHGIRRLKFKDVGRKPHSTESRSRPPSRTCLRREIPSATGDPVDPLQGKGASATRGTAEAPHRQLPCGASARGPTGRRAFRRLGMRRFGGGGSPPGRRGRPVPPGTSLSLLSLRQSRAPRLMSRAAAGAAWSTVTVCSSPPGVGLRVQRGGHPVGEGQLAAPSRRNRTTPPGGRPGLSPRVLSAPAGTLAP